MSPETPSGRPTAVDAAGSAPGGFHSLIRHRAGTLVLFAAAATLGFALTLPRVDVSNPPSKFALPTADPVAMELERFQALFGAGETLAVAFDYGRPVTPRDTDGVRALEQELRALPGVERALVPGGPMAETFVGRSGEALLVVLELEPAPEGGSVDASYGTLLDELIPILDRHAEGTGNYHLAGLPLINRGFEEHLRRDVRSFTAVGLALAIIVLLALYRDLRLVLVSGAVGAASVLWALGMLSLARTPLSTGVAMMIPLILMLSVAYSAHYLGHWTHPSGDRSLALAGMLHAVVPPSIITGLVTALGFFALTTSALEGMRDAGLHFGLGALAAAVLNMVVVPAALYRWVPPRTSAVGRTGSWLPVRASAGLRRMVLRWPGPVIAGAAVLAALSLLGLRSLRVDSNHLAYFDPQTRLRNDYAFVDEEFGGVIPLEIVVRVPEPGLASDLEGLTNLTAAVRDVDGIGRVVAPQEFVPPAFGTSPAVWHRMSVMEGPSRYVREREGGLVFRISAGGYIQGSDGLSRVVSEVRQLAHDTFGDRAAITGLMPVFARTMDHIVGSQLTSFAIAVTAVALLFLLLAPSGRIGVMAVTANVLPILLVLGGMGWMGLPIDFGTAMIASVLIGIAVHDTVHVLFGLRRERARGASVREALATTFDVVGPPVVASTVVFCGGLLVLVFSDFAPVRHFGLLSCAVMVAALLADLILLPALVAAPAGGS